MDFPVYAQLLRGFERASGPGVSRTAMEDGLVKQLERKSKTLVSRGFRYLLKTNADYNSFKDWVREDIHQGTDWFDWTDPEDAAVKPARIVNGAVKYKPQRGDLELWIAEMDIEVYE